VKYKFAWVRVERTAVVTHSVVCEDAVLEEHFRGLQLAVGGELSDSDPSHLEANKLVVLVPYACLKQARLVRIVLEPHCGGGLSCGILWPKFSSIKKWWSTPYFKLDKNEGC
jgi:hypothetical protein